MGWNSRTVRHEDGTIDRDCTNCRRRFSISTEEQVFFQTLAATHPNRNVVLPMKCYECRQMVRASGQVLSPKRW